MEDTKDVLRASRKATANRTQKPVERFSIAEPVERFSIADPPIAQKRRADLGDEARPLSRLRVR